MTLCYSYFSVACYRHLPFTQLTWFFPENVQSCYRNSRGMLWKCSVISKEVGKCEEVFINSFKNLPCLMQVLITLRNVSQSITKVFQNNNLKYFKVLIKWQSLSIRRKYEILFNWMTIVSYFDYKTISLYLWWHLYYMYVFFLCLNLL